MYIVNVMIYVADNGLNRLDTQSVHCYLLVTEKTPSFLAAACAVSAYIRNVYVSTYSFEIIA